MLLTCILLSAFAQTDTSIPDEPDTEAIRSAEALLERVREENPVVAAEVEEDRILCEYMVTQDDIPICIKGMGKAREMGLNLSVITWPDILAITEHEEPALLKAPEEPGEHPAEEQCTDSEQVQDES